VAERVIARRLLALLRHNRSFRHLFLAQMLGTGAYWFVQIPVLVLLYELTGGGLWGALTLAADTGMVALLLPYAGTVVDRVDRRRVMLTANATQIAAVTPLLTVRSADSAWVAVAAVAALAAGAAFYRPAAWSALPNLVAPADLATANAAAGSAYGTVSVVASSVGGLLVAVFDPYLPFLLTMVVLAVALVLVRGIREPFQAGRAAGAERTWFAIAEGMRYVWRRPHVRALVTVKSAVGLGNGALTIYPLLAASMGVGAAGTGLLFAVRGLGILLGPFVLNRVLAGGGRLMPGLALSMAAFGLSYVGAAAMPTFVGVLAFVLIAHIAASSNWALSSCALQEVVPDELRGRIVAVDIMLSTCAVTLSQLAVGAVVGLFDIRALLAACGATTVVYAILWRLATVAATPTARPLR